MRAGTHAGAPGLLLALVCGSLLLTASSAAAPAAPVPCARPALGFMGPLTGAAAFIGKEQLGFARYAVRTVGRRRVRLVEIDTQLQPRRAASGARRLHADPNVLAVVGPAASREVLAVAPILRARDRLPFVSASALSASLTNGSIPNFFRVVPHEGAQAPTIARHIGRRLKARRVAVVDDATSYSRRLADAVQVVLRRGGVTVRRASVARGRTDFSSIVRTLPRRVQVVFLPWTVARNAQLFGRELRRQRSKAVIVGSDGLDSGDFRVPGSYVAAFAPDIRAIAGNASFIRGYRDRFVSNFGPPAYVAAQVALLAIRKACAEGGATRSEVERALRRTSLRRTVLGSGLRFTPRGDAAGSRFAIFRVNGKGEKTLVG